MYGVFAETGGQVCANVAFVRVRSLSGRKRHTSFPAVPEFSLPATDDAEVGVGWSSAKQEDFPYSECETFFFRSVFFHLNTKTRF